MHSMRTLALFAVFGRAHAAVTADCEGAKTTPTAWGPQFAELRTQDLRTALSSPPGGAHSWRVSAGWESFSRDNVTITSSPGDDAAAWTCALTDGEGVFRSYGGEGGHAVIPAGSYALTCDLAVSERSTRPPVFSTWSYPLAWTTCTSVTPVPPCVLQPTAQTWGETGDGTAKTVTFVATVAIGTARLTAVDVMVTGDHTSTVAVSVASDGGWKRVGTSLATAGTAHVVLDTLVTVYATGVAMSVEVTGTSRIVTTKAEAAGPPASDGAYATGDTAFVGSLWSLPGCEAAAGVTPRAAELVTPAFTSAFSVSGWDPSTVAMARVNLFAEVGTDPKVLLPQVFPGMLAIPNAVYPAQTFTAQNVNIASALTDPTASQWDNIRLAVADALKGVDPALQAATNDITTLRQLVSLSLGGFYSGENNTIQLGVGIRTSISSISNFMTNLQANLNTPNADAFAANGQTVLAINNRPCTCIEVLLYGQRDFNIKAMHELVADQYANYGNAVQAVGANSLVITIGEVYLLNGTLSLPVPSLSKKPAIAMGSATAVWVAVVAVAAGRGRLLAQHIKLRFITMTHTQ